jgi:hypothetical protein
MKLYQGHNTVLCGTPNSSVFNRFDLFNNLIQGTGPQDRIGTKIRVFRLDIQVFVENNPLQTIPEENIQMILYKTKQYLNGPVPTNHQQMFLRPLGTIATIGPTPALGGTNGSWIPRMWLLNPTGTALCKVMAIKNFNIYQQGAITVTGTTTPNVSAVTTAGSANINSVHRFRHFGKYVYNFRKGMTVLFSDNNDNDIFSYINPSKRGADNHMWISAIGETTDTYAHTLQIAWNIWYTDQ